MRPRRLFTPFLLALVVCAARAQAQTTTTSGSSSIRIGVAASTDPSGHDRYPEFPVRTTGGDGRAMPAPGTMTSSPSHQPTLAPPRPAQFPPAVSIPSVASRPTISASPPQPLPTNTMRGAASLPVSGPSTPAVSTPVSLPVTTQTTARSTWPVTPTPVSPPTNALPPNTLPPSAVPPARPKSGVGPATSAGPSTIIGGVGRPGEKGLEGAQQPSIVIEKLAPAEIQVGKPAVFEIIIRNVGGATAGEVEVRDVVPQGTQLLNTTPKAASGAQGELVWTVGTLRPGDEAKLAVEVLPTTEGELGSVATVRFAAAASARTICTKPELVVEVQAPRTALAGDDVPLRIKISNPGSGVATGVLITEVVPANMTHEAGGELEYEVGDLRPGEARELDLTLKAVKPGAVLNLLHAKADGKLATEAKTQIDVVAASLAVEVEGPKKRFLDRQATYTVSVANPGTATARGVELATFLPRGLQFVEANNSGEYDPATHSVRWLLEELPAKERGTVTLTMLPIEPGQQVLRIESSAERGIKAQKEEAVLVEGAPSIVFQVVDSADPIEVGGETTYQVKVANDGSKEATHVGVVAVLPEGLKVLDAEGPTGFKVTGRSVQFQPLDQLPAKGETTYRIRVQCTAPGDHRCQVQLTTADMRTPVTKEEGTRAYANE